MNDSPPEWFVIKKEKAVAYGREEPNGFLVRAGSTAMRNGSPNEKRNRPKRDELIKLGILVNDEDPDVLRFSCNHIFSSRSQAAGVVIDGNSNGHHWTLERNINLVIDSSPTLLRTDVEAAMDAYDRFRSTGDGDGDEIFGAFGEPRDYWVRSTRERPNRIYPSKPIVGFIRKSTDLSGGWGQKHYAAASLYNAGYVIIDSNDAPLPPPQKYGYLIPDADRIRLCARNYYIDPARENRAREVSIRASELSRDIGLQNAFPAICSALGGKEFQRIANVPPPTTTVPNPSSSTVFTYQLAASENQQAMTSKTRSTDSVATNLILYGPPGTGKTYATRREAVQLCTGRAPDDVNELAQEYSRLVEAGRIEFVTFHQSYSYEDFVEALRPMQGEAGSGGFRLEPTMGVFRRIARRAETSTSSGNDSFTLGDRRVFKMSIGEVANPDDAHRFEDAISGGYAVLGFDDIDWSDPKFASRDAIIEACTQYGTEPGQAPPTSHAGRVQSPFIFRNWIREHDLIVVSKGNLLFRAIGEVTGPYQYAPDGSGDYSHRRAVRWLWVDRAGVPVEEIFSRVFSQRTIYLLERSELNVPALERYIASQQKPSGSDRESFVLIVDEINRANISKVFGELITLLEADKRLGAPNEVRVRLPYSHDVFGVPPNLHIIGTMNTADRSIALLDTALRRRFVFRELMPDPDLLKGRVEGVDLPTFLRRVNERIEYLFDREHQIGHALFMCCRKISDLDEVMRHSVIPLLQEYFYEDWNKVAAVLGDSDGEGRFLARHTLPAPFGLEGDDGGGPRYRWTVKAEFGPNRYA